MLANHCAVAKYAKFHNDLIRGRLKPSPVAVSLVPDPVDQSLFLFFIHQMGSERKRTIGIDPKNFEKRNHKEHPSVGAASATVYSTSALFAHFNRLTLVSQEH